MVDYIEGQPDPPEKSASTDGKQVVRLRDKDSKEPMHRPTEMALFGWLMQEILDTPTMPSLRSLFHQLSKVLDAMFVGKSCVSERLYRVRCYSRRLLGAVSELKDRGS